MRASMVPRAALLFLVCCECFVYDRLMLLSNHATLSCCVFTIDAFACLQSAALFVSTAAGQSCVGKCGAQSGSWYASLKLLHVM